MRLDGAGIDFGGDAADRHDVGAVGELERERRLLLDQQDGETFAVELAERFQNSVDDLRREAERGLVQQQQLRLRTSARGRPRASAARRRRASRRSASAAPSGAGTARARARGGARIRPCRRADRRRAPDFRATLIGAKMPRPSGTSTRPIAAAPTGFRRGTSRAAEPHRAVGGDEPHDGAHQGGFAGPVRSEHGDELAFANEQIDGRQRLDMPVARRERFDVQNAAGRAHFATSTLPFTILASSSGFSVMPW